MPLPNPSQPEKPEMQQSLEKVFCEGFVHAELSFPQRVSQRGGTLRTYRRGEGQ